jgi:predicted nuclease of predicted toxin-antitoxin system
VRFLLDESVEYRLSSYLRDLGHDVTAIAHDYPSALSDLEVLAHAQREGCILITNDRDFGELIYRLGLPHHGVIYFRLPAATVDTKLARLEAILADYSDQMDQFLVVTEKTVRVRRGS